MLGKGKQNTDSVIGLTVDFEHFGILRKAYLMSKR
jgi:hypothetical protein